MAYIEEYLYLLKWVLEFNLKGSYFAFGVFVPSPMSISEHKLMLSLLGDSATSPGARYCLAGGPKRSHSMGIQCLRSPAEPEHETDEGVPRAPHLHANKHTLVSCPLPLGHRRRQHRLPGGAREVFRRVKANSLSSDREQKTPNTHCTADQ